MCIANDFKQKENTYNVIFKKSKEKSVLTLLVQLFKHTVIKTPAHPSSPAPGTWMRKKKDDEEKKSKCWVCGFGQ